MAIKSVKYPKKGTGYLYNKLERPVKPDIYTRGRYKKDENRYKEEMDMYEKDMEYYKEHKGEYVLKCSNNLVGRKFIFDDKKINIIFGPNGSGKSTIIKSIAGVALIIFMLNLQLAIDAISLKINRIHIKTCGLMFENNQWIATAFAKF